MHNNTDDLCQPRDFEKKERSTLDLKTKTILKKLKVKNINLDFEQKLKIEPQGISFILE